MGNCTSAPLVADDDLIVEVLAPGPDHAIARFKNQDVAALAAKYMPPDALTASAKISTTTPSSLLISSFPSAPPTFHHLPPLALGALGDNSLDEEPGARTPGRAPTLTPPTLSQAPPSHLPRHCELPYAPPYIPPPGLFPAGGGGGGGGAVPSTSSAPPLSSRGDSGSWRAARRRAVFVAVGSGPLGFPGAVSDAECVRRAMARAFGFSLDETIFLHDGGSVENGDEKTAADVSSSSSSPPRPNPQLRRLLPTRANIMASARWLASGARPGDSLVFAFFGRGGDARGRPLGEKPEVAAAVAAAESSSAVAARGGGGNGNDSDEEDSATSASPSGKNKRSEQKDTAPSSSNAASFFLRPPSADGDEQGATTATRAAAAASCSTSSPRKEASDPSSSLPRVAATLLPCDAGSRARQAQPSSSSSSSAAAAALFVGKAAAAAAAATAASSAAAISSADLRAALVDPLPAGARLLVLVDAAGDGSGSCPKGFGLNLPASTGHRPDGWPCWESANGIATASTSSGAAAAASSSSSSSAAAVCAPPSSSSAAASTGGGEVVLISGCCEQPRRAPARRKQKEAEVEGEEEGAGAAEESAKAAPAAATAAAAAPLPSSFAPPPPPLGGDLAFALVQALEQGHGTSLATLSRAMRYAVRNGGRGNDASSSSVGASSADCGGSSSAAAAVSSAVAAAATTPPAPPAISATRRFDLWRPLAL